LLGLVIYIDSNLVNPLPELDPLRDLHQVKGHVLLKGQLKASVGDTRTRRPVGLILQEHVSGRVAFSAGAAGRGGGLRGGHQAGSEGRLQVLAQLAQLKPVVGGDQSVPVRRHVQVHGGTVAHDAQVLVEEQLCGLDLRVLGGVVEPARPDTEVSLRVIVVRSVPLALIPVIVSAGPDVLPDDSPLVSDIPGAVAVDRVVVVRGGQRVLAVHVGADYFPAVVGGRVD
jgi:hypothetical protein